jgi:hypothetical protein
VIVLNEIYETDFQPTCSVWTMSAQAGDDWKDDRWLELARAIRI